MPKVSVIIPTHNRPESVKRAVDSVLAQTHKDLEVIVVDDGVEQRAESILKEIIDPRLKYIAHDKQKGGSAARNTGIRAAQGDFIAFLDDDDEWLPEKLEIQMAQFEKTPAEVGFCFCGAINDFGGRQKIFPVFEGMGDFFEQTLRRVNGFLTVTLIIKKAVFEKAGLFDDKFPNHQEAELMIRVAKHFNGLGINQPLVRVDMSPHERVGGNLEKRIIGRKMLLEKHAAEYEKFPAILARHFFWLGLMLRDAGQRMEAKKYFKKAWRLDFHFRYFFHYLFV